MSDHQSTERSEEIVHKKFHPTKSTHANQKINQISEKGMHMIDALYVDYTKNDRGYQSSSKPQVHSLCCLVSEFCGDRGQVGQLANNAVFL